MERDTVGDAGIRITNLKMTELLFSLVPGRVNPVVSTDTRKTVYDCVKMRTTQAVFGPFLELALKNEGKAKRRDKDD